MTAGTPVNTPLGPGTVVYVRMDHLGNINDIAAVSVLLDSRRNDPAYGGTIFHASKVARLDAVS